MKKELIDLAKYRLNKAKDTLSDGKNMLRVPQMNQRLTAYIGPYSKELGRILL